MIIINNNFKIKKTLEVMKLLIIIIIINKNYDELVIFNLNFISILLI